MDRRQKASAYGTSGEIERRAQPRLAPDRRKAKPDQPSHHNGQEFILLIWGNLDCKINAESDDWGPGFQLIQYLTHNVGVCKRGLAAKLKFLEYITSF